MTGLTLAVADGYEVAKRDVVKIRRVPDLIVFAAMGPTMFVLLFAYVFGSAIEVPGVSYREYLMAGIFTQTVVFGASRTGIAIAEDIQHGMIERFRTLPMAPSALLVGRSFSDILLNLITLVFMSLTGLVVGWRIHSSVPEAIAGFGLMLLFAYSLSWMMAVIGLWLRRPDVLSNAEYMVLFPLTFVANTFVDTERLPTPLRVFAEWNPVSAVTQATRQLFGNVDPSIPGPDALPLRYPVVTSLVWIVVLLLVFIPMAIRLYRRAVSR